MGHIAHQRASNKRDLDKLVHIRSLSEESFVARKRRGRR
jgi:hypothetical protein